MSKLLTIVVPTYNECEVFSITVRELSKVLEELIEKKKIDKGSKILFVNDGSKDNTWELIKETAKRNSYVTGVCLSKNFGHQNALLAGLSVATKKSDMMISIDADLQDDVDALEKMVDAYNDGFDIVYGVRDKRDTDTFFKKHSALAFYKIMRFLGANTIQNHADFRLMSKRAVNELLEFPEKNLFLRGMVALVGFPTVNIYYNRKERAAGKSKYPLKKMISFAWNGITSFSNRPLKFIMRMGILTIVIAIAIVLYSIVEHMRGSTIPGWSSLMISIWFVGGVQLVCIAVIGEYIGKIFTEVKGRPRFIIMEDTYSDKVRETSD